MSDIKLRDFLQEGAIIRTKLSDCTKWVTNLIQDINDDCIEIDIGLERDYLDNLIMTGDTLKCKYTNGNIEFNLIGWITKIKLEPPQAITIRVHQVERFDNNRDSYRYDIYLSSVIKRNKQEAKGVFAVMTNISSTGAAFIVKEDIEKQFQFEDTSKEVSNVFVEVYISADRQFSVEGMLLRKCSKEKGIEYGVRFMEMDSESEKTLHGFLNELANKDKEIYNKRSGFWSKNSKFNN